MARKVAPVLQSFIKLCQWKKRSCSDFCNKPLEYQIAELRKDIKELEERVGMTDGTKNNA